MKIKKHNPGNAGLTLIEMLAVLAIVAILVGILLPVLARQRINAKAKLARIDCSTIAQAITQYNMDNIGRFPMANDPDRYATGLTDGKDITFSLHNNDLVGDTPYNADLMIILSAIEGLGGNNVNAGHSRNSKKMNYLGSKFSNSEEKGWGPDGIFRDPFGNPYVVTVDKNNDGKCWDMHYGNKLVSGHRVNHVYGFTGDINVYYNGIEPRDPDIRDDEYLKKWKEMKKRWELFPEADTDKDGKLTLPEFHQFDDNPEIGAHGLMRVGDDESNYGYVLMGKAMVWSAGPDRMITPDKSGLPGCPNKNSDNIIGW